MLSPISFTVRDPDPFRPEDAFGCRYGQLRMILCCHVCHVAVQGWVAPEFLDDSAIPLFDLEVGRLNAFLEAHGQPPCSHTDGAPRQPERLVLA